MTGTGSLAGNCLFELEETCGLCENTVLSTTGDLSEPLILIKLDDCDCGYRCFLPALSVISLELVETVDTAFATAFTSFSLIECFS